MGDRDVLFHILQPERRFGHSGYTNDLTGALLIMNQVIRAQITRSK